MAGEYNLGAEAWALAMFFDKDFSYGMEYMCNVRLDFLLHV